MPEPIKYKCSCCGEEHEEWPSLNYDSPTIYKSLSDSEKKTIADLSSEYCTISHPDQIYIYIPCTLRQKVIDYCEDLEYCLWVSISDKSFKDYADNYYNENHETKYFGWLSNNIPDYDFDDSIPTTIFTRTGNQRPEIIPHNDFDHPFVHDYYNGITKAEAERRIKNMMDAIAGKA